MHAKDLHFPRWSGAGLALAVGLALTRPAEAGENLPPNHNLNREATAVLETYIRDQSRPTLKRLTELIRNKGSINPSTPEWQSRSKNTKSQLESAWKKALELQQKDGGKPPIPPVLAWYKQETDNWNNVVLIGELLMKTRDDLVIYRNELERTLLPRVEVTKREMEQKASRFTFYLNQALAAGDVIKAAVTGMPPDGDTLDAVNDSLKKMEEAGTQMNPIAAYLTKRALSEREDIKRFATLIGKGNYASNVDRLVSQRIDTDGTGFFYEEEKLWDAALKEHLSLFTTSYDKYKAAATPFLQNWIVDEMKRGVSKLGSWFRFSKSDDIAKLDDAVEDTVKGITEEGQEAAEKVRKGEK